MNKKGLKIHEEVSICCGKCGEKAGRQPYCCIENLENDYNQINHLQNKRIKTLEEHNKMLQKEVIDLAKEVGELKGTVEGMWIHIRELEKENKALSTMGEALSKYVIKDNEKALDILKDK